MAPAAKPICRRSPSLGFVVTPIKKWAKAIARAIATSLRTREGEFIYQSAAIRMPEVPREAVLQNLPAPKSSTPSELSWEWESLCEVSHFLSELLPLSGMATAGATRAIQRPSEPVIRVLATMMGGLEMKHVVSTNGSECLTINFLYILMGEMGDLYPPKDPMRREIGLSNSEVAELRQVVLADALMLGERGAQLSPGWWRQLGDETSAQIAEAHLTNLEMMRQTPLADGETRRTRNTYEIESVQGGGEEGLGHRKVRWAGYHPSWEAWRLEGEPGTPIKTWERRKTVKMTQAYAAWTAAQE
ncbi:hypothetical protein AB1Y20_021977 [Prymnesium parvum]|uniref:Uncharacterized protein n=1 Tax=Prymnesium parvum TaxID=97485 RepID=A0AB34JFY0_PRYPA